jgi:hypothetical protein
MLTAPAREPVTHFESALGEGLTHGEHPRLLDSDHEKRKKQGTEGFGLELV